MVTYLQWGRREGQSLVKVFREALLSEIVIDVRRQLLSRLNGQTMSLDDHQHFILFYPPLSVAHRIDARVEDSRAVSSLAD
jgi:hypothetical protein